MSNITNLIDNHDFNQLVSYYETNKDKPWNYYAMQGSTSKVTWDFIVNNSNIDWNYQRLSFNENITIVRSIIFHFI